MRFDHVPVHDFPDVTRNFENLQNNPALDLTSPFINVQSPKYGARGDGTTDDAPAIQAAIDAAPVTGAVIYLPTPAVGYLINTTLTWSTKPIHLLGPVSCNSVPGPAAASGTKLIVPAGVTGISFSNGINGYGSRSIVENLHILGNDAGAGTNDGIQVRANGGAVIGCHVEKFGRHGIHVLSGQDGNPFVGDGSHNANCWYAERTRVANNYGSGLVATGIDSNAGLAAMIDASGNHGEGIWDNGSFGSTFVAPQLEGNLAHAIRCGANSASSRFIGVYKEGDANPALLIEAGNRGQNVVDFRVLVGNPGETVVDSSGSTDNVIVDPGGGLMKQSRLLIGTQADGVTVVIESAGSSFFLGTTGDTTFSRLGAKRLGTNGSWGYWGVTPPGAQPAAITSPTAPSAGYVQAEAQSMKTAVDAIRTVLAGYGMTA